MSLADARRTFKELQAAHTTQPERIAEVTTEALAALEAAAPERTPAPRHLAPPTDPREGRPGEARPFTLPGRRPIQFGAEES